MFSGINLTGGGIPKIQQLPMPQFLPLPYYKGTASISNAPYYISQGQGIKQMSYGKGTDAFQSNLQQASRQFGIPQSWFSGITEIARRESGWDPNAKNQTSTAYGYAQFLDSTRANYERKMGISYSNPVNQLGMMAQYIRDRYGDPASAVAFWDAHHWY